MATTRVLVTRAGSGAATNLIRGLRRGIKSVFVVGSHDDPFVLKKSTADRNYLILPTTDPRYLASLSRVVEREAPDLIIPVSDTDIEAISTMRRRIPARVFVPQLKTLALCGDKLRLAAHLRRQHVPAPASYSVPTLDALERVFGRLPKGRGAWCRARRGAGSVAAAPVADAHQARAWISLWCQARGMEPNAFMIAEHLPGRDFACQSLWRRGTLVLIKTTERLAYVDGASRLSGTSSVASLHKTVYDLRLLTVSKRAVQAVDRQATGAFSVDLKEDAEGQPCVTEINAGRLLSGTTIFDEVGRHNMSATYLRLGTGKAVTPRDVYDSPEGHYVTRDLDTPPHLFDTKGFWSGWIDARTS